MNKLVSTYIQSMVESSTPKDEHEEFLNEYIPRLFAPATGDWLFNQCRPLSTRKKPPPEDTGEYEEFPRTEWVD